MGRGGCGFKGDRSFAQEHGGRVASIPKFAFSLTVSGSSAALSLLCYADIPITPSPHLLAWESCSTSVHWKNLS